tara:strand:+ start:358 stop:1329 length:972 start_codon:yes stop_codon:yes gene_type:complete
MKKPIAIIAGEPNSISSEIIFKSWKLRKKHTYKPLIVIGSFHLLNLQRKKLKYRIKLRKVRDSFLISKHNRHELMVYDVKYMQRLPFQKISVRSNKYIFNCFDIVINLLKNKRILGFINCPIAKEFLFKNKHQGITEFLSKKMGKHEKETMLIYNKKLSVSPLTTHVRLKDVSSKIKKSKILNNVNLIYNFFKRNFNKKPNIGILGLNPHNYSSMRKIDESKIILSAIRTIKKSKIKVMGPISPDTSFMLFKKYKLDVIIGMYHDQVLTPFKTLFKYDAINITLGLPCIRVSPDHGVAENIMGKKIANPKSLIECIKFFNHIK